MVYERHNNYWFMKKTFLFTSQCLCVKEIPTDSYESYLNPAHIRKICVLLSTIFSTKHSTPHILIFFK
jgi:hypothetical protein